LGQGASGSMLGAQGVTPHVGVGRGGGVHRGPREVGSPMWGAGVGTREQEGVVLVLGFGS
jgi:hypothetical protein